MAVCERCDFCAGDLFDGKYRIERSLGEGSFGIVYKAKDSSGNDVAIKLLKLWAVDPMLYKNMSDRFVMEFETGKIKSNFLVHSITYGEVKGNPYIVMEFCKNGDLRDYVSRNSEVNFEKVGAQILSGLSALHSCGKVHRDLKPENVLLREDHTAVLTDFGISGDQNKRMTERGFSGKPNQIFGTYPYMPPEQVNPPRGGQATVLPTTDIFSFGVMMYELMVGKLPFGELNNASELMHYLHNAKTGCWDRNALNRVKNASVWLAVLEGCLKPDYKERIQSADQVRKMLPVADAVVKDDSRIATDNIRPAVHGYLLRIMQGEEFGKEYRLDDILRAGCLLKMGRNTADIINDVYVQELNTKYISRLHCTLEKDSFASKWYIRDGQWNGHEWKESLNGTYVNSTSVDRYGLELKLGDIVSIGDVKLRVEGY